MKLFLLAFLMAFLVSLARADSSSEERYRYPYYKKFRDRPIFGYPVYPENPGYFPVPRNPGYVPYPVNPGYLPNPGNPGYPPFYGYAQNAENVPLE